MAVRGLGRLTNGIVKLTNIICGLAVELPILPLKILVINLKQSNRRAVRVVGNILLAPVATVEIALGTTVFVTSLIGEAAECGTYYLSKPSINAAKAILKKGNPRLMEKTEEKHPYEYYFTLPSVQISYGLVKLNFSDRER